MPASVSCQSRDLMSLSNQSCCTHLCNYSKTKHRRKLLASIHNKMHRILLNFEDNLFFSIFNLQISMIICILKFYLFCHVPCKDYSSQSSCHWVCAAENFCMSASNYSNNYCFRRLVRFWDETVAVTASWTRAGSLHTCLVLCGFVSHSICETAAISQSGEWVCEEENRWGSLLMKKLHTLSLCRLSTSHIVA